MVVRVPDEALLLALLNSTPVIDGRPEDRLGDPASTSSYFRAVGVDVDDHEHDDLVRARDLLQSVVRAERDPAALAPLLAGVRRSPHMIGGEIVWSLETPDGARTAVRAVVAHDELNRDQPGRLRPCANSECRLFFVDRSRPGTGRWCSMAVCGNRLKARRHQARTNGRTG